MHPVNVLLSCIVCLTTRCVDFYVYKKGMVSATPQ